MSFMYTNSFYLYKISVTDYTSCTENIVVPGLTNKWNYETKSLKMR